MGFRNRIIRALGGVPGARPRAYGGTTTVTGDVNSREIIEALRGGMYGGAAMRIAVAWRCVHIICGLIATLPLDLYIRKDEDTRLPAVNDPLRDVLTVRPNGWQTPSEFRRMLQAQLLMHGYGAALKVRTGGRITALIPMRPGALTTTQNSDYSLNHTYTALNGKQLSLKQNEVFYLRGLTFDGVTPLSILSHARVSMGLSLSTEHAAAKLMRNGSFIGGTFEHPGRLSDEAYERLKRDLQENYSGAENTGNRIILEEGMKVGGNLGFSARDLQFLELKDFSRSEVAMFFGVPPHLYGDTTKATSWGTGIEQQNIGFLQYTMQNWLTTWEEAIKRDLISDRRTYARFDVSGMLRTDLKSMNEAFATALGSGGSPGWMTPNEVRSKSEMPQSDDPAANRIPHQAGTQISEGESNAA